MALFQRKSPASANDEKVQEKSPTPVRRGRVEEPLLHETVWETTVDACRNNPLFCVRRDDELYFVGLYMPFSEIGGLSKKDSKNNESKGSIVGQINHGRIVVMSNASLASKEAVVFIPTQESVSNMAEYSLLGDTATYEFCFINADSGELELTGVKTNLTEVQALHLEKKSVSTIPAIRRMVDFVDGSDSPAARSVRQAAPPSAAPVSAASAAGFVDEMPVDDDYDDDDEDEDDGGFVAEESAATPSVDSAPVDTPESGSYDADDDDSFVGDDEGLDAEDTSDIDLDDRFEVDAQSESAPEQIVSYAEEASRHAIMRKFFDDDINVELTTGSLDQALADVIPFHPVQFHPGGWLDDQINSKIAVMNKELEQLHQRNLLQVRSHYLDTLVGYYMAAAKAVDAFKDTERYQQLVEARDEARSRSHALVANEWAKLKEEFEAKVKEAGEAGRYEAEQRYRERYSWEFEQRKRAIETDIISGIDASFEKQVGIDKNEIRKGQNAILDEKNRALVAECCLQYAELAKAEESLREVHAANVLQFVDDNRKYEIDRTAALLEEQARDDRVSRIQKEYDSNVAQLKQQFDALSSAHESNIAALKQRHEDERAAQDNIHRRDIAVYASDNQRQQSRIDELTKALVELDEKKSQEYAVKIVELETQRDAGEAKYNELVRTQRKGNRLMVCIACLTAVLTMAIGIGIGYGLFSSMQSEKDLIDGLTSYVVNEQRAQAAADSDGSDEAPVATDEDAANMQNTANGVAEENTSPEMVDTDGESVDETESETQGASVSAN